MDALENIVRTSDPDRYIAALFAPAEKRAHLFALYALNHELGHIAEAVREPMMAEIRLQWWRDALAEARAGKPRGHDVLQGMAKALGPICAPEDMDAVVERWASHAIAHPRTADGARRVWQSRFATPAFGARKALLDEIITEAIGRDQSC